MANSYNHLDIRERILIETQLTLGLRRARSPVTREMHRNGWKPQRVHRGQPAIAGGYRCVAADRRAHRLAVQPRVLRKLIPGSSLWSIMVEHLRRGLSPAQIASTLGRMPDPVRLSHETIYTALYTMPRGHLRSSLLGLMRRHRAKKNPRMESSCRAVPSRGRIRLRKTLVS
jgi:IS30 family transposase